MIRITITAAAYAAIAATLPKGIGAEPERVADGRVWVWLPPAIVNALAGARGPGESYSDVILRAAGGAAGQ